MNRSDLVKNVKTVVVVMMENRSFDHVLGFRTDAEGIADVNDPRFVNPNGDGVGISPFWASDGPLASDLPHDKDAVKTQLALSAVTGTYAMNGFVAAYEKEYQTSVDQPPVMGLLRASDLPATAALAAQYTVCDHWFACLPTSTAPNRLMSMCGYTTIDDTGTFLPDQQTVYDWLSARGVRWRVYHAGLPFLTLMPRVAPLLLTPNFRKLADLEGDVANEPSEEWPQVIFVEPDYYDCPIHLSAPVPTPCDNHAPLAMAPGEAFLGLVYRWLTSNPAKWASTLFIVTYDEHGGFFDHVPPPRLAYRNGNVAFDSAGVRVPTIVGGPFAPRGVCKTPLDNTSILQLFADLFGRPGEAYSPSVSARAETFASVSSILSTTAGNTALADVGATPSGSGAAPTAPGNSKLTTSFSSAIRKLMTQHQSEAVQKFPELESFDE